MNSGVMRQYLLGTILLLFAIYLSVNDSNYWALSFIMGTILIVVGNINRRKHTKERKD
ncbi:hypothetical protein [Caryophanon tenue]|uniref:hypothetical protein n=1 Tax=Caryophanon tenue TaxID=33978 RepID=UPI00147133CC|nr:hypothetical protein [Caryophanon tenue]